MRAPPSMSKMYAAIRFDSKCSNASVSPIYDTNRTEGKQVQEKEL